MVISIIFPKHFFPWLAPHCFCSHSLLDLFGCYLFSDTPCMMPTCHSESELLYLGGDSPSEEYCVAEIEGRWVGEHTQPVSAMGSHAERAVPLIQSEEERCEVQRDKNAHPHGPVERPHEGSDGCCRVPATNLNDIKKHELDSIHFFLFCYLDHNCYSYSLFPEDNQSQHHSNYYN